MGHETSTPVEIQYGGFGKLPQQGDFIRVSTQSRELEAWERWLQHGLLYSRNVLASEWEHAYHQGLHHWFVFRPDNSKSTVVGVIRAASDAHHRRYPFTCFALIPTALLDGSPSLLPRLHDALFSDLEQRIEDASALVHLGDIQERLKEPRSLVVDLSREADRYDNFLDELECRDLGSTCGVEGTSLLAELLTLLQHVRHNPRQCPVTLELPLQGSPHTRSLELRFWIELCLLAMGWYPGTLSLFWPARELPARSNALLLSMRQPPAPLFGALITTAGRNGLVWLPGRDASPFGRESAPFSWLRSATSLRTVLSTLSPGYPDACRWNT